MKWLKNFERLLEIQRNVVWPGVMELEPKQIYPEFLKAALAKQPLAVSIEADQKVFQYYSSGVMDDASCGTYLDHAVLTVGWGNEGGQDYWLVKNSWNTTWGDQGYIKLAIVEGEGICGVQMEPETVDSN